MGLSDGKSKCDKNTLFPIGFNFTISCCCYQISFNYTKIVSWSSKNSIYVLRKVSTTNGKRENTGYLVYTYIHKYMYTHRHTHIYKYI